MVRYGVLEDKSDLAKGCFYGHFFSGAQTHRKNKPATQ